MTEQRYPKGSFAEVIALCQREAANENWSIEETVDSVISDLALAGFSIKRSYALVDYNLPLKVLLDPPKGSAASFDARPHTMSPSVDDLQGHKGWLVTWSENGRAKSGWFDDEGRSLKQPHYRVVNPKTPCAGAVAASASIGKVA